MSIPADDNRPRLHLAWLGIRPRTLPLALIPVLVGSALAWNQGEPARLGIVVLTALCAVLIQAGTNLFNDASDAERGNDGPDRRGPTRLTGSGLASAAAVKRGAWAVFSLAVLSGAWLSWLGGWPILLIGLGGLLAGWAYSRGPLPLSHTPWGEVFVVGFFGLAAVLGSYLLQGGEHPAGTLAAGLALGLPASAVLLVNNLRDRAEDAQAGRRTLAQTLGTGGSCALNLCLVLLPFPLLILDLGFDGVRYLYLSAPLAGWLGWRLYRVTARETRDRVSGGAAYNQQLQGTVLFHLVLGLTLLADLLHGAGGGRV